jgi:hypothetical protein
MEDLEALWAAKTDDELLEAARDAASADTARSLVRLKYGSASTMRNGRARCSMLSARRHQSLPLTRTTMPDTDGSRRGSP